MPRGQLPQSTEWKRIDLGNVTLLPGFIDMHVHLADDGWFGPQLLANGITTVRDVANNPEAMIALRKRQQQGLWIGPKIFTFGPLLDGEPAHWPHISISITHPNQAEAVIDRLVAMGVDGFKMYIHAAPDLVREIILQSHKRGKRVTGHLMATSVTEALSFGVDNIEHMVTLDTSVLLKKNDSWSDLDIQSQAVTDLLDAFRHAGTWLTPTLAVTQAEMHFWGQRFNTFPGYNDYPAHLTNWLKNWTLIWTASMK